MCNVSPKDWFFSSTTIQQEPIAIGWEEGTISATKRINTGRLTQSHPLTALGCWWEQVWLRLHNIINELIIDWLWPFGNRYKNRIRHWLLFSLFSPLISLSGAKIKLKFAGLLSFCLGLLLLFSLKEPHTHTHTHSNKGRWRVVAGKRQQKKGEKSEDEKQEATSLLS